MATQYPTGGGGNGRIQILSETVGIDCTVAATTPLYVVPPNKTAIINSAVIDLTAKVGGAGAGQFPIVSTGVAPSTVNIYGLAQLLGLNLGSEYGLASGSGTKTQAGAGTTIQFDVATISNATTYDVTVYLLGILI